MPELSMIGSGSLSSSGLLGFLQGRPALCDVPHIVSPRRCPKWQARKPRCQSIDNGRPVMATTTFALARFSAGNMGRAWLVTLALAGAVAVASPAAADPTGIAVVESLTRNLSSREFINYVGAGQAIRIGPHQTIVLRYMASCVRETITGGTVTVGTQRSEVQSGHARRIEGHCYSGRDDICRLETSRSRGAVEVTETRLASMSPRSAFLWFESYQASSAS